MMNCNTKPLFLLFLLSLLACAPLKAQELNCKITINSDMVQGVDRRVFADMQQAFQEFMNLRRWTETEYKNEERILCNINITITEGQVGKYKATATIQYARPVFGTSYNTVMFNYVDNNWAFEYVEGQPMNFNKNSYFSNLTSLLGFYAYFIIGLDQDTFAEFGGQDHLRTAQNILNYAGQDNQDGWQSTGSTNNRYWLIENFMNEQVRPYRKALYLYHRKGLDMYLQNEEKAHKNVLEALTLIQKVNQVKPVSVAVNNFFDVKSQEIVNLLSEASYQQRQQAFEILKKVDPTRTKVYNKLMSG